jgi:iron complex outermembrane receptor protein
LVWKLSPDYRFAINGTQAQRAPTTEELYSHGFHGATTTFETGNPNLKKEVSRNLDVSLSRVAGATRWKVNLFVNHIKDYVYAASGDSDGDGIPDRLDPEGNLDPEGEFLVQNFTQADARFYGAEAQWSYRPEGGNSGIRVFGDIVRAKLKDGTYIPRIAPGRLGLELDHGMGAWSTHLTVIHSFAQNRVAPLETTTPAYTKVDAEIAYRLESKSGRALTVFLQGSNLADQEIRLHTSYLKDVAPLMGRSFTIGLRGEF